MWKKEKFGSKLESLGISRNDPLNTVLLPTTPECPEEISQFSTPNSNRMLGERARHSSLHTGNHSKEYATYMSNGLAAIFDDDNAIEDLEKKELATNFLSSTKQGLMDGLMLLNSVGRSIGYAFYSKNHEFKYIEKVFQVHHLIPREFFREKRTFASRLLSFANFEKPDFIENLSSLPQSPYLPPSVLSMRTPMKHRVSTGRSTHRGSHPKYTKYVRGSLNKIYKKYKDSPKNPKTKLKARKEVLGMLVSLETKLSSGELELN
jgi:hypothetical protein